MELTKKQKNLLSYLAQYKKDHEETPSLRQCAIDLGVSHTAIAQMVKTLENKGAIKRGGKYDRYIKIINKLEFQNQNYDNQLNVPIIGNIAAGLPLYAQQEWAGNLVVDAAKFQGTNLFALTINGDSMKNAAILDGDLVICAPRQFAEAGEIVVALINSEEATVKRFFKKKNKIELRPENNNFKSIFYNFDEVLIQGKIVGVIRTCI